MARIKLDNLTFDYDTMSAQDMWDFERESGGHDLKAFAEMFERGIITEDNFTAHLKEILAFVWIIVRKDNPGVTYEEIVQHPLIPLLQSVEAINASKGAPKAKARAA